MFRIVIARGFTTCVIGLFPQRIMPVWVPSRAYGAPGPDINGNLNASNDILAGHHVNLLISYRCGRSLLAVTKMSGKLISPTNPPPASPTPGPPPIASPPPQKPLQLNFLAGRIAGSPARSGSASGAYYYKARGISVRARHRGDLARRIVGEARRQIIGGAAQIVGEAGEPRHRIVGEALGESLSRT
jgi:hypothetical protein